MVLGARAGGPLAGAHGERTGDRGGSDDGSLVGTQAAAIGVTLPTAACVARRTPWS
ncbi:hypothetical protein [Streptomyces sp. NPDC017448]|uniref:hypothetical protein n=1 Tax=Streptomyces sp. NPDC017448 TaxID=3364996 RepID=UPI0037A5006E